MSAGDGTLLQDAGRRRWWMPSDGQKETETTFRWIEKPPYDRTTTIETGGTKAATITAASGWVALFVAIMLWQYCCEHNFRLLLAKACRRWPQSELDIGFVFVTGSWSLANHRSCMFINISYILYVTTTATNRWYLLMREVGIHSSLVTALLLFVK